MNKIRSLHSPAGFALSWVSSLGPFLSRPTGWPSLVGSLSVTRCSEGKGRPGCIYAFGALPSLKATGLEDLQSVFSPHCGAICGS